MHCRIDFIDLANDSAALDRLADALNDLYDDGVIQSMATQHDANFYSGIHWAPQFLPWHRHFLLRLEQLLQAIDARIVLPYWDWTRADSRNLDIEPWKSFFGGRNNTDGRFDHWAYNRAANGGGNTLPTLDDIVEEQRNKADFTAYRAMECGSHFPGHTWTGGTMAGGSSPLDPLFYLHHGNLDRLWAIWQRNNPGSDQYLTTGINCGSQFNISPVNPNDPMVAGATPASMLDHLALGFRYPRDIPLEVEVAGDPDFPGFQSGDAMDILLETPQIVFNDVPSGDTTMRAAFFTVEGCAPLQFEVESGPTGNFSLSSPGPYPYPAGPFPTNEFRIWVMFTGGAAGFIDPGGVMTVVARDGLGNEVDRWDNIPILANSVARPTVAVALVLDESGSMLSDAGNNRIRIDVLQDAAKTFVDQLYDDNALTLISFADSSDKLTDLTEAGALNSGTRIAARNEIDSHGPPNNMPLTSIGAGLQRAATEFTDSPIAGNYDVKATVVFTDGYQTRAPYIDDVSELINDRVYAVGIADANNVQNDTLVELANNSDGYVLVTGALEQDDDFLLEKFFIQILAGVTNQQMVVDPGGWLSVGSVARIPFNIASSDIGFDAVALNRAPTYLLVALEAPDGTVIDPSKLPANNYRLGHQSNGFRVTLPVVVDGKGHWEGQWHLLMALRFKRDKAAVLSTHSTSISTFNNVANQSALRYEALVHARSNLQLRASVEQNGLAPGSTLFLHAAITEYGQPLSGSAAVKVTLTEPDGTTLQLAMSSIGPGIYETKMHTSKSGAHRFRIQASGLSKAGHPFTREHLLTALIGRKTDGPTSGGGGTPGSGQNGGSDLIDQLCKLLTCLSKNKVFDERFLKLLAELGIDGKAAAKCLRELCDTKDVSRIRQILEKHRNCC
jgi:hypothetical protein